MVAMVRVRSLDSAVGRPNALVELDSLNGGIAAVFYGA